MTNTISCYRCGTSLEKLTLPLSRRDECPDCSVHLHVCRMCVFFDVSVPRQCVEDGAEEVADKTRMNYCDWFKPSSRAFDPHMAQQDSRAKDELASLFGDGPGGEAEPDAAKQRAEDLFK